jgi:subtilisin family serine protease
VKARNLFRFAAAGVLSSSLIAGCATVEEDFAVDTTVAPLVTVGEDVRIPGQYIVVFKDTVGEKSLNAAMNRVSLKSTSSRIQHQYTVIPGFSARLSPEDLDSIRRLPEVAYVEQDQLMFATATKPSSGQLELATHDSCPASEDNVFDDHNCNGTGVLVYVVDTGIRATHNDFGGRVNTGRGFTAINDGRGTTDCNGHGSHVASTAAGTQFGMASGATLVPVRVLGCDGSGSNSGVINGVNHVRTNCAAAEKCVANMSLGGGVSSALDSAVTAAVNAGIPFAVAAGNSNANVSGFSPARAPAAITVGCASDTGFPGTDNSASITRCSFSNFGAGVDIWARGLTILGADDGSNTATQTISGTSMSSPHVAGAIAQMLHCQGDLTVGNVEAILDSSAISGAMSSSPSLQGAQNLYLCSDFDGGTDSCACGGGGGPAPVPGGCVESNSCGGEADAGCFCDSACVQFGDCCPDGPC